MGNIDLVRSSTGEPTLFDKVKLLWCIIIFPLMRNSQAEFLVESETEDIHFHFLTTFYRNCLYLF